MPARYEGQGEGGINTTQPGSAHRLIEKSAAIMKNARPLFVCISRLRLTRPKLPTGWVAGCLPGGKRGDVEMHLRQ